MLASEAELGRARRVLLDGEEAFAWVRGYTCDAAAVCACYREHVGPPAKPLKSQIGDLQRALGMGEVPGVPDELARLLAEEKEEGADDGARKVKEDWGTPVKRLGRFLKAALKVTLDFFVWLFRAVFKWVM